MWTVKLSWDLWSQMIWWHTSTFDSGKSTVQQPTSAHNNTHTLISPSPLFLCHFPSTWTWVNWLLLGFFLHSLWKHTFLHKCHKFHTCWMPLVPRNQQCPSTKDNVQSNFTTSPCCHLSWQWMHLFAACAVGDLDPIYYMVPGSTCIRPQLHLNQFSWFSAAHPSPT